MMRPCPCGYWPKFSNRNETWPSLATVVSTKLTLPGWSWNRQPRARFPACSSNPPLTMAAVESRSRRAYSAACDETTPANTTGTTASWLPPFVLTEDEKGLAADLSTEHGRGYEAPAVPVHRQSLPR